MKILSPITCFFLASILFIACSRKPHPEEAVSFNDSLVYAQDTLFQQIGILTDFLENEKSSTELKTEKEKALIIAKKYYSWLEQRKPFDKEDEFRNAGIEYFGAYVTLLEQEFQKLIELMEKPYEKLTSADQNSWDSLLNVIIVKDSIATLKFFNEQQKFSKKYGFTLKNLD